MFLLRLGELLEEWTRKKSLSDLARCMSLNVDRVWQRLPRARYWSPSARCAPATPCWYIRAAIIPLDGRVLEGEASGNQASPDRRG